jgi:hypothetical protein
MNHSLNRLDGLRSWLALPPQPRDAGMVARDLAILAAVFLAARVVAFAAILQRGLPLVRSDGQNYIWIAESLLADGTLPTDQRQFPGFGILIAILSWVTGAHPVLSGFILVLLPGTAAIWLFYLLTRNLRLSILLIFILPGWASTGIMSEGIGMLCLLCAVVAFGRTRSTVKGVAMASAAGLLMIIKPPLVLAVVPMGAVAAWEAMCGRRLDLLLRGMLFVLPFLVYVIWTMSTMGTWRPEAAEQLRYTIEQSRGYYPPKLMSWPGHSLILGLLHPSESPLKQASVLGTVLVTLLAAVSLLAQGRRETPIGSTGLLLGLGVLLYLIFHLFIGGPWGFNTLERYLAQISPFILVGLFRDWRPRAWVLIIGALGSLGYTSMAGRKI